MLSALSQPTATQTGVDSDPVRDVNLANFIAEVIEASKQKLVVVDFWAPWCGPCKQLGPALEKLVRAYKGAVHLAKIDIDQNQQIAQQMGVQSIPAVFAFFRGQPIDGFMGALPEAQLKAWLERLVKTAGSAAPEPDGIDEALKKAAALLAAQDIPAAQTIYSDVLDIDQSNAAAYAGLLRCLIALGDTARAREILDKAPPEMVKDKSFDPVRAALELAEQAAKGGGVAELQKKVGEAPTDHQARFDLAMALYAAGQREESVDQLLEIVRHARKWNEDAARKQLLKLFEAFGAADPLTVSARKRLSSILFS